MIAYLIKSGLCMLVLMAFYTFVLEAKPMHHFKRFFLLLGIIFALTIPLITLTYTTNEVIEEPLLGLSEIPMIYEVAPDTTAPSQAVHVNYWSYIFWTVYGLGFLVFGARFILNLFRLKRKITQSQKLAQPSFTLALLKQSIIPHSFLKYIFLSRKQYNNQEIAPEVIAHEATHVRQRHSLDILFIEFLQVVFWFNPLFWIAKKSIKLNHEFLADQGALQGDSSVENYQNLLFNYASDPHQVDLESAFNYSLTKKRILMLSQTFSRKRATITALVLIPVLIGCVLLFNNGIVKKQETIAFAQGSIDSHLTARSIDLEVVKPGNYKVDGILTTSEKLGSTLASLHTDLTKEQRNRVINIHILSDDKLAYEEMVTIQKAAADYGYHRIVTKYEEIVRSKGNAPMVSVDSSEKDQTSTQPRPVKTADLKRWKDASLYGIWIDGKRVNNSQLAKFRASELPHYTESKLAKNAINYGKHYFQVNIMTRPYFEKKWPEIQKFMNGYAKRFTEGAQRNGKKALVLEIRNDNIRINGKASSLKTFQQDLDEITKDWEEQDYTEAVPSFLLKNNSDTFIEEASLQFQKSHFSKANGGMKLMPPPPPSPPLLQTGQKGDTITFTYNATGEIGRAVFQNTIGDPKDLKKAIKNHHKNKGVFVRDGKKISYQQALDFAGDKIENAFTIDETVTPPVLFISVQPFGKVNGKLVPFVREKQNPVTPKELAAYNAWAKKLNNSNDKIIKKREYEKMYAIYNRMTETQKKNAEPFPALPPPPPPPPAPKKVKKGEKSDLPPPPPPPPAPIKVKKGEKSDIPKPPKPPKPKKGEGNWLADTGNNEDYGLFADNAYDDSPLFGIQKKTTKRQPLIGVKGASGFNSIALAPNESQGFDENAHYYFKSAPITVAEAKSMLTENKQLKMRIKPTTGIDGKAVIFLYDTPLYQPMPKATPRTIGSHIKAANRHKTVFLYNGTKVSYRKALKLVRKNPNLNVITTVDDSNNYQTTITN